MIRRFFHADSDVVASLGRAVQSLPKVLVVTQLHGTRDMTLETRSPFRELLACAGERIDIVVVIDEGRPEGMWRDPMGALCERLFPDPKEASMATTGYVLVHRNVALGYYRKALWDPQEDAELLTQHLAQVVPGVVPFSRKAPEPEPEPTPRPRGGPRRRDTPIINPAVGGARRPRRRDTPIINEAVRGPRRRDTPLINEVVDDRHPTDEIPVVEPPPPALPEDPPELDPYEVLGLEAGVPFEVVKKKYRMLILQYHPDRAARLPDAERVEAEQKAREINVAFEMLERALNS